jgi:hypothetical protein
MGRYIIVPIRAIIIVPIWAIISVPIGAIYQCANWGDLSLGAKWGDYNIML